MNNITKVSEERCTGCGACYNKCPFGAITMQYNSEGFISPVIDESKCTDCGACLRICPAECERPLYPTPDALAVMASDEIRKVSSSGGMFSLLAEVIFERRGVVCGARYSEDYMTVYHDFATCREELMPLRGSKYVQSETGDTYKKTKEYLDGGTPVLYTGCPCQIAGLYAYLGKPYDNLYTADLICHGSNSVSAYRSFVTEYAQGREIAKLDFRDKVHYEWSTPTVMYFKDGSVKKSPWNDGRWYEGFLDGIINRNCCYECRYAGDERVADVTLGDAWQIWRINKKYDDRIGTSLVLANSEKGKQLVDAARGMMKLCEPIPLAEIRKYNGQLNRPTKKHPSRAFFFSHLDTYGYHKALWYGKGMRFDVGIVGWWFASNYGSSLTYYALATILQNMGKQVLFIPIPKLNGTPWEREIEKTVEFIGKRFRIGRERTFRNMPEFNKFCDSFLVGSDQMWTPSATELVGYTFFLDFADADKKKIAFSTSFGKNTFAADEKMLTTATDYLKRFDAISVREHSGIDVCRDSFGIEVEQIIDPVFMCKRESYEALTEGVSIPVPKKYMLCYILDPTPEKEDAARNAAAELGLEVIAVMGMKEYPSSHERWHVGTVAPHIGTEEFLSYLKNASYLLTDSHHGVCMGIIFGKQYAALVNASRGATRFEAVADALGLRERLVYDPADIKHGSTVFDPIDYDAVNERITAEYNRAQKWLCDAFAKPTVPAQDTAPMLAARCNALEHDVDNTRRDSGARIKALEAKIAELEARVKEAETAAKEAKTKKGFSLFRKRKDS